MPKTQEKSQGGSEGSHPVDPMEINADFIRRLLFYEQAITENAYDINAVSNLLCLYSVVSLPCISHFP